MAKRPTQKTITSGFSSANMLNYNVTEMLEAFDNTLSLDGSAPNAMAADLDLNSNDILNAGDITAVNVVISGTLSGAGATGLTVANNLSDVASASTAATNLGLGTGDSPQFTAVNVGAEIVTAAKIAKLDDIEALADVTDATNVTAAGALMDSEVTNLTQVKAFDTSDYATSAQGTLASNALPKAGGALTGAVTTNSTFDGRDVATDGTKLDAIEALADVTDATNVLAALVGQEVVATGFTGTLDGTLGSGTPAAATVTTLNASGNVGINQVSPTAKLDVNGSFKLNAGSHPTGSNNIALGSTSGASYTGSTFGSVAIGVNSDRYNTGNYNVAVGTSALAGVSGASSGGANVAIGSIAGTALTTASSSVLVGHNAGKAITTGGGNVILGATSAQALVNGINNVAVGNSVATSLSSGSNNVFLGVNAGDSTTTSVNNIIIGNGAAASSAGVHNEITLGNSDTDALRIPGVGFYIDSGHVLIGTSSATTDLPYAPKLKLSGSGPGLYFEETDTSQAYSISALSSKFIIRDATVPATRLVINSSGNIGINQASPTAKLDVDGSFKLNAGNHPTGTNNIALGDLAGNDYTGSTTGSVAVGLYASRYNTGNYNVALGRYALRGATGASTGGNNVAVGNTAGMAVTTAHSSVLAGYGAGNAITTGVGNVILGSSSAGALVDGTNNVCIGNSVASLLSSGTHNVILGVHAGDATTTSINNIIIGNGAAASSATVHNEITLGNSDTDALRIPGVGFYIDSGNVGIGLSNPAVPLHVSSNSPSIRFTDTDDNTDTQIAGSAGGVLVLDADINNEAAGSAILFRVDGASEKMRLTSAGRLGIGLTNPAVPLDVNGSITTRASGTEGGHIDFSNPDNASTGLTVDVSSAADTGRIFQVRDNSRMQIGQLVGTGGTISLYTGGSERMSIVSNNVGINQASPTAKLDVNGTFKLNSGNHPVGTNNIALGNNAGANYTGSTTGSVSIGLYASQYNPAIYNIAIGRFALRGANGASTGARNVAIGTNAGMAVTTADTSVLIGHAAAQAITTGGGNVILGSISAQSLVDGTNNVCIGDSVATLLSSGSGNVILGVNAGDTTTTGGNNIILGNGAAASAATVSNEITLGNASIDALRIPGVNFHIDGRDVGINTVSPSARLDVHGDAVGETAGDTSNIFETYHSNGNGSYLSIKGVRISSGTTWTTAGTRIEQKTDVTAQGYIQFNGDSDSATTFGFNNVEKMRMKSGGNFGIGTNSPTAKLDVNGSFKLNAGNHPTGSHNIALGGNAGASYTGSTTHGVSIGSSAAHYNTASSNVAIGTSALKGANGASTGASNVAVGTNAGMAVTTAHSSVLVGYGAGNAITTGSGNVLQGNNAAVALVGGSNNVAIGNSVATLLSSGISNVIVGVNAGDTTTTGSNNTILGNGANASSATVSNEITLGNASVGTLRCQVTSITALSDMRDKTDITDLDLGLDYINALRPVEFVWAMRDADADNPRQGTKEAGFIAQELRSAEDQFDASWLGTVLDTNPDRLEATPGKLLPIVIKALQEASAKITELTSRISTLEGN